MDAQGFARNAYKIFKKVLTITRNACIIKTVKDTTQTHGDMEVAIMEKLTADEFATKVMATGTELEVDELQPEIGGGRGQHVRCPGLGITVDSPVAGLDRVGIHHDARWRIAATQRVRHLFGE